MNTRSVAGLGCLLAFLSATACEPDDSARDTGKAGELLAENRTWSRCDFVEGADCYYANPCTEWVDGDTMVDGHTWQRVYYRLMSHVLMFDSEGCIVRTGQDCIDWSPAKSGCFLILERRRASKSGCMQVRNTMKH